MLTVTRLGGSLDLRIRKVHEAFDIILIPEPEQKYDDTNRARKCKKKYEIRSSADPAALRVLFTLEITEVL